MEITTLIYENQKVIMEGYYGPTPIIPHHSIIFPHFRIFILNVHIPETRYHCDRSFDAFICKYSEGPDLV